MNNSQVTARMTRGMKKSCAVLAFAAVLGPIHGTVFVETSAAYAQASAQFSRVDVSGNTRIASDTVRTISGIKAGTRVTPGQINAAVQNLYDSGLFEKVSVRPDGGRLMIEVAEHPTINEISIEGNRRLKDDDLIALVGSIPRRAYSPTQAEADTLAITNAYAAAGRLAAKVEPKIIRRSDNRVDLVFEVREGRIVEVNRINFTGNRVYSDRRLRRSIDSKQAGLFRTFVRRDTFIPERLEFDKEKLKNFYLKRGYIDAEVLSSSADLARERNSFGVNFQVQEGQQYSFGNLAITSSEPDINVEEFQKALKIKAGRVYDPDLVNTTLERLDVIAANKGLPFVQALPRVTRNDDTRTLDIDFDLARGRKLFIERIDIEGNSETLDRVIRREFESIEGDPFNSRKVQAAADRIRALDFFERVDVQTREGSAPDQVIIDVNVVEQPTGTLGFGLGYGTDDGLNGNITLSENNFLGRGQSFSLTLNTSSENREFTFGFSDPKMFDRDLLGGIGVSYRTTNEDNTEYNTKRLSVRPRIGFPVGEYARLEPFLLFANDEIIPDVGASPLIQVERGSRSTYGLGVGYTFDRRNSPIDPTGGFIFSIDQTVAGFGGDNSYYQAIVSAKTYRAIYNEEVILSAELDGGLIHSTGNGTTTVLDRYQLGGNSFRGFESFGLGPRDVSARAAPGTGNYDSPLGGNFFAIARLEASFPIGLPDEYGVHGGLFMDIGSVWGLDRKTAGTSTASSADFELRSAIGISIFWDTALGPLRFNFAKPIEYVKGVDKTQNFNFTVDTRF